MIRISLFYVFTVLLWSCKTANVRGSRTSASEFTEQKTDVSDSSPMSCRINGKIISIQKEPNEGVCARHPCEAMVEILEISECGSSLSEPISAGETIPIHFTFTLAATDTIFPDMKKHYPGLKVGSKFTAFVQQRLRPGANTFIIYDYTPQ